MLDARKEKNSFFYPVSSVTSGFTLIELMVALFIFANVMASLAVSYSFLVRYAIRINQKTAGTLAALAGLKLITDELVRTSCEHDGECAAFDAEDDLPQLRGIVRCADCDSGSACLWGRKHDPPSQNPPTPDQFFRFTYDAAQQRLIYCPSVGGMSDTNDTDTIQEPPGPAVCSNRLVLADNIVLQDDDTAEGAPFICDAASRQVRLILRSIEAKNTVTGAVVQSRRFESSAAPPFGCETGC
ncbi:MAG: prepilin-type N-terminal cleavage/methylation domain-containing protein [Elusimicrobia bacterium]|nr:prepilin-type N-terminal cleavage/methylation domain-containing protein [Elusimicrobiota bacterium]